MTKEGPAGIDDSHGFIHARCQACASPDVWLTCNTCSRSDRLVRAEDHVQCHCGASYTFATCTCGEPVPIEHLEWVHFDKGPAALADWEWDRSRLVLIGAVLALVLAGIAIGFWLL